MCERGRGVLALRYQAIKQETAGTVVIGYNTNLNSIVFRGRMILGREAKEGETVCSVPSKYYIYVIMAKKGI